MPGIDSGCKLPALVLGEPDDASSEVAFDRASPPALALKSLKPTPILKSIKESTAPKNLEESGNISLKIGGKACKDGAAGSGDEKPASLQKKNDISAILN